LGAYLKFDQWTGSQLNSLLLLVCPASHVKKTKVRPDYSSAPTQLALRLRLATTYKARAATRCNPRWLDSTMQN
jgi:hypothetical protein